MTIPLTPFDRFVQGQLTGSHVVDFDSDTIKLALTTSVYTPNKATHEFFTDVTNEISGGGYASGGNALSGKTVGLNTSVTPHFVYWLADALTFAAITNTFRRGVLYYDHGSPTISPLIAWMDWDINQSPAGINYVVQWAAAALGGILKFSILP